MFSLILIFLYPSAVLMLDDDTLLSAPDVSFAFSVWKVTNLNSSLLYVQHRIFINVIYFHSYSNFQSRLLGLCHGNTF